MPRNAEYWIRHLGLLAHPEGGYFKEAYRSTLVVPAAEMSDRYAGGRNASTSIYFLVTSMQPSHFHRLETDEVWHHYEGDTLEIVQIHENGVLELSYLGKDPSESALPQLVVSAGTWFAARVVGGGSYSLCGCTMAPGFDFADFVLARRSELVEAYPAHAKLIEALTGDQ